MIFLQHHSISLTRFAQSKMTKLGNQKKKRRGFMRVSIKRKVKQRKYNDNKKRIM